MRSPLGFAESWRERLGPARFAVTGYRKPFTTAAKVWRDPANPSAPLRMQGCVHHVTQYSATTATGTRSCSGKPVPWTATISGTPVDDAVPTLLTDATDPRRSAAHLALGPEARDAASAEVANYRRDVERQASFIEIRDPACLGRQYLHVRLQKPEWPPADVARFIRSTCIVSERVTSKAAAFCTKAYLGRRASRYRHPEAFCGCYAQHVTAAFLAAPHTVTTDYQRQRDTKAAAACVKLDRE